MRIFKNKWFAKFARQNGIEDSVMLDAVLRANMGLIDADLGGGLIKQRVARKSGGKSGGFRTLLFFRGGDRGFFVYGFAKNDKDNISSAELVALKKAAKQMLELSDLEMNAECEAGAWIELNHG
jgi:hypothetical protein